ncbi:GapA-binding peptide SR1P [Ectobacillus ponti]|uniref:GapA-binding peptide SR1P n=1 Tax=Ectobacillus ponti TaxID=2961894 RepID=A0AA42BQV7_9BACI|nr:GapA-binding peptide SR1P [Ectobacillus ponti]MCP8970302.1 GapA-binding peptide SR1P [Ectobacillus ponti]
MGTIVCQVCEGTIAHFEDEKVTVLYGQCCPNCAPKRDTTEA